MAKRKVNIGRSSKKTKRVKIMRAASTNENTTANNRFQYYTDRNYAAEVSIGTFQSVCEVCNAKLFREESLNFCCGKGSVQLEPLPELPPVLTALLTNSKPFLSNIRKYNNAFSMTSLGCNEMWDYITFKINGKIYHRIGSLIPLENNSPQFLQIYFLGNSEDESKIRLENNNNSLDSEIITTLQTLMHSSNVYVKLFKCAYEKAAHLDGDVQVVIRDSIIPTIHKGRTNAPTTDEVAVFIGGHTYSHRDVIVQFRENGDDRQYKRINETHKSYDPMQYPLMFPYGTDGYHINILKTSHNNKKVSAADFYLYRLMVREDNYLLLFQQLLNVYIVDMWTKIESERLLWIRLNQTQLRVEEYAHLRDAYFLDKSCINDIGKMIILPSTYTGSPRYMMEKAQDALCYVRKFGSPHLFITMTCNPNWSDIKNNIHPGQQARDRYDIVSRVFYLKVKKLKNVLIKEQLFGPVQCYLYSIEWQKRGLPHVHLLLWLKTPIKADEIDSIINAEIPNSEDKLLYDIVTKHMVHGPCGYANPKSPCMEKGKCVKRFPRDFINETSTDINSYPLYRRRNPENGGFSYKLQNGTTVDNRWIVPYNPILTRMFECHINVEYCHSVKSIHYICKYVCKGEDKGTLTYKYDEVERYLHGRYVSTSEAAWRIFQFPIHERHPAVIHLNVHLPNGQRVYFNAKNAVNQINNPKQTTLLAFFKLCSEDTFAQTLLYSEIPSYYTWNDNSFQRRKRGTIVPGYPDVKFDSAIGRMYTVSPRDRECFFLRLLLNNVRGPTSYIALRTVESTTYATFEEACRARGLLINDNQWEETLKEAVLIAHPNKLRELFVIIVVHGCASNPLQLWETFKIEMSDDIHYRHERIAQTAVDFNDDIFNEALLDIQDKLNSASNGRTMTDYGLPIPIITDINIAPTEEYYKETHYNRHELQHIVDDREGKLNVEQQIIFDTIMTDIDQNVGKTYYLDAPGGTGKTFLLNLLLAKVRLSGCIALGVASSGIAATLILNGRTAHSTFKLPLNLAAAGSTVVCNIKKSSTTARILRDCKLIIWDEVTMSHRHAFEALDRTLRDIKSNDSLMGGITMLLTGDFRQTLPVIPRGTRADTVHASLKYSSLWPNIIVLPPLKTNMRLTDQTSTYFAETLEKIGNGTYPHINSCIATHNVCTVIDNLNELINVVWGAPNDIVKQSHEWIRNRAILCPRNDSVNKINQLIMDGIESSEVIYNSVDRTTDEDEAIQFPIEFLESIEDSGLPPHALKLKIGVPVILIRNMRPPHLCNGTRLIIDSLCRNVLEATILTGVSAGEKVWIPRIPLTSANIPFSFVRMQFPVKLCFSLSINKAQGQTYEHLGVYLEHQCFSHGQLYVAFSRISSQKGLFLYSPSNAVQNIVYKEVL